MNYLLFILTTAAIVAAVFATTAAILGLPKAIRYPGGGLAAGVAYAAGYAAKAHLPSGAAIAIAAGTAIVVHILLVVFCRVAIKGDHR